MRIGKRTVLVKASYKVIAVRATRGLFHKPHVIGFRFDPAGSITASPQTHSPHFLTLTDTWTLKPVAYRTKAKDKERQTIDILPVTKALPQTDPEVLFGQVFFGGLGYQIQRHRRQG